MTKSNRGYFGRSAVKMEDVSEIIEDTSSPAVTQKLEVVSNASNEQLDDQNALLAKIEALEMRVKTLEDKLNSLITVLSREMASGLKLGPEGFARALKSSGII